MLGRDIDSMIHHNHTLQGALSKWLGKDRVTDTALAALPSVWKGRKKSREERGWYVQMGGWDHPRVGKETRTHFNKKYATLVT